MLASTTPPSACIYPHLQTVARMPFLRITGNPAINETLRECVVGPEQDHVDFASSSESERVLEWCKICFRALALQRPAKLMTRGGAIVVL